MRKLKEYKTTSKIDYAFIKYYAMEKLANTYVVCDKHDRAVKAFIDAEILRGKAWVLVYELYPKIKGSNFSYFRHQHKLKNA